MCMKEIELISGHGERWRSDITRIKKILIEKGYNATLTVSEMLWDKYSDSMCAGWMNLPDEDEEVFNCISSYLD